MKTMMRRAIAPAAGMLSLLALGGCYAYPAGYYADAGGYGRPIVSAPVYVAPPPVVVPFGFFGGYRGGYGGYRGGYWRR